MANRKAIENLRLNCSDDMCKLAEMLGYKGPVDQLQCRNGAFVSSLLAFFDDNPGAMSAVAEWVAENHPEVSDEDESCEECGDDLDDEGCCVNEECPNYDPPVDG